VGWEQGQRSHSAPWRIVGELQTSKITSGAPFRIVKYCVVFKIRSKVIQRPQRIGDEQEVPLAKRL